MNNIKKIVFDNGLTLTYGFNDNSMGVGIMLTAKCGLIIEPDEMQGASHFIEHMLFKGTKKRDSFQTGFDLDKIGAFSNAFTTKERTSFYAVALREHAEECMEILSDMYFNATFPDDEFEKERNVILEELNECIDDHGDFCYTNATKLYYGNTIFGGEIVGTEKTLKAITVDSLRKFKDEHYTANNTVITIYGNITEEEAVELVEKYCLNNFKCENKNFERAVLVPHSGVVKVKRDINQNYLEIILPGYDALSEKRRAAAVFVNILGGGYSSRLFQELREKRALCYSVDSSNTSYVTSGFTKISSSFNNSKTEDMLLGIKEVSKMFLEKGIKQDELDLVKEQAKTAFVLSAESSMGMTKTINSEYCVTGRLFDAEQIIKEINAVSKDDVMDIAKEVLDFNKAAISFLGSDTSVDIEKIMLG